MFTPRRSLVALVLVTALALGGAACTSSSKSTDKKVGSSTTSPAPTVADTHDSADVDAGGGTDRNSTFCREARKLDEDVADDSIDPTNADAFKASMATQVAKLRDLAKKAPKDIQADMTQVLDAWDKYVHQDDSGAIDGAAITDANARVAAYLKDHCGIGTS